MSSTGTQKLMFFDIDAKSRPWSPNTWKTRFLLNYKRIPYKTEWVRFEDIEGVSKKLGLGPTNESFPFYTLPAIVDERLASGPQIIADSVKIAEYIEARYPERPLCTQALLTEQKPHMDAVLSNVAFTMFALVVPAAVDILDGPSVEYYTRTRPIIFGEEQVKSWQSEDKQDELWANFKAGMDRMAAYISSLEHNEISFFSTGTEPVYSDFCLALFLIWLEKAGPDGGWEKVKGWNDGLWERAYRNCESYMQVI